MTWQWVALIAIAAVWTLVAQAIHAWKEVQALNRMPEDVLRASMKEGT